MIHLEVFHSSSMSTYFALTIPNLFWFSSFLVYHHIAVFIYSINFKTPCIDNLNFIRVSHPCFSKTSPKISIKFSLCFPGCSFTPHYFWFTCQYCSPF
ncbi:hypothetical protein [Escherichia phage BI-EHEC]|nr:hypothetical protein [Escherichia phage BI-EHEC]